MGLVYLELPQKLAAVPQDALDLRNPQQGEVLGESQGHVPYLQAAGSTAVWAARPHHRCSTEAVGRHGGGGEAAGTVTLNPELSGLQGQQPS